MHTLAEQASHFRAALRGSARAHVGNRTDVDDGEVTERLFDASLVGVLIVSAAAVALTRLDDGKVNSNDDDNNGDNGD